MDSVINPIDSQMQRQRDAHAAYTRLRAELADLAPDHPDYTALRAAMRQAERHWRTMATERVDADALAALAALGLSRRDFSPWSA